ncbi:MAG: hypothetical protein KatS3mg093_075 [Candidatus Parcubacteria bacterium]|nr:MAG: hypothetical protein KatS3mg093_075 [Candidatus Parcubacteria bacterium]
MKKLSLLSTLFFFSLLLLLLIFQKIPSQAQATPEKPGPVSNITFSDITTSSLKISWDPATNTVYYNIYRGYKLISSTTKTYFIDFDLIPNFEYQYVIESVNSYYGAGKKPGSYGTYVFAPLVKTLPLDYPAILAFVNEESPLNVYRGYGIYKMINVRRLASDTPGYYIYLATTTADLIVSLPDFRKSLEDKAIMNVGQKFQFYTWTWDIVLKIQTTTSTPLGINKVKIKYGFIGTSTPEKELEIPINVRELNYSLPNIKKSQLPPLPGKSLWEKNMIDKGKKHCHVSGCCGWEGGVWYYDGLRVFYNILDYTKDPFWFTCVSLMKTDPNQEDDTLTYRERILQQQGHGRGWQIFTTGLTIDYFRTLEQESKQAVYYLSTRSPFANLFYIGYRSLKYGISSVASREIAYAILTNLDAIKLGFINYPEYPTHWGKVIQPRDEILRGYVDMALGHLDQWFDQPNSPVPYVQPFMFGLTAEALITYYEEYEKDPRIPIAIKKGLDWIWENMKATSSRGTFFIYVDKHILSGTQSPNVDPSAIDLNLLIAPAYAWYYHLTGDEEYIRRGDILFETAVGPKGAWVDNGKQFSQNYRWSFKYLEWRDGYKLTPYIPPTSSFLSDYRQYLKIALFSDNYNPQSGNIITYRAILKNISTTTLIRTKFSFPLFSDQKYVEDSAYLTINNIKYRSISYRPHQLIILIPYLSPQQQATLIWKMIKK